MSKMKVLIAAGIAVLAVIFPPSAAQAERTALYNSSRALQPEYAKWGRAAMQAVNEKYDADIVDYAYEGRYPAGPGIAEYRFRLWLRKGEREFGVRVVIRVNTSTNEQVSLSLTEL